MYSMQILRSGFYRASRQFSRSAIARENKSATANTQKPAGNAQTAESVLGTHMYKVTKFDKWLLVWVKKYPNLEAVPEKITEQSILQARSKGRIKVSCYMMAFAAIMFLTTAIISRKQLRESEEKKLQKFFETAPPTS